MEIHYDYLPLYLQNTSQHNTLLMANITANVILVLQCACFIFQYPVH